MSDILIDAALLACPDPEQFQPACRYDVIDHYLTRLASLSELRSNLGFVRFWRDRELLNVLHEASAYPFRHSLAKAFATLAVEGDFQLEDVTVLANALLARSAVLEDEGDITDLVLGNVSLVPDFDDERSDAFKHQLFRTLALALPILGDGNALRENVLLATSLGDPPMRTASFTVELIEDKQGECAQPNSTKTLEFSVYSSSDTTITGLDLYSLWNVHRVYEDCMALQAAREDANPASSFVKYRARLELGGDFIVSADNLGFLEDQGKVLKLLRVIADLLHSRNLADSHWLRNGMGANDSQRMRGVWAAWRHDIDYEFHLHYWRNGQRLELANIVTHNDFSISK